MQHDTSIIKITMLALGINRGGSLGDSWNGQQRRTPNLLDVPATTWEESSQEDASSYEGAQSASGANRGERASPSPDQECCSDGRAWCSEQRRLSDAQSSSYFGPEATIGRHPETGVLVFKTGTVDNRQFLKILDQSLIQALDIVGLDSQRGVDFEGAVLSAGMAIHEPYHALFQNRKRIDNLTRSHTGDDMEGKHARLLLDFIITEHNSTWRKTLEVEREECQRIAFEDLCLLYPVGQTVFRRDSGWRAYKVGRIETGIKPNRSPLRIYAYYLGFDKSGQSLVPHLEMLTVSPYQYEKQIWNLDLLPEWYVCKHLKMEELRNSLILRGKKYWKYSSKPFLQEYHGDAWRNTLKSAPIQVMVDYATTSTKRDGSSTPLSKTSYCQACLGKALGLGPFPRRTYCHDQELCFQFGSYGVGEAYEAMLDKNKLNEDELGKDKPEEDILLYCPSQVWAFSLRHNTWEQVHVSHLTDVKDQKVDWYQLKMADEDRKTQLDLMVASYLQEREFGNPIFGRRRGLNVLLHGGSGTGKTFTAELLAKRHKVPLYEVSCSSITRDARSMKLELQTILSRAANWGALLLLKHADNLIQARLGQDAQQDTLVSTLLDTLDSSEALVFFSASYSTEHDPHIISRMHLTLHLSELDAATQNGTWLHAIESVEKLYESDREDLNSFVKRRLQPILKVSFRSMNGREIKSCFRAALALATREQPGDQRISLKGNHIEKVLRFGNEFKAYVRKTCDYYRAEDMTSMSDEGDSK
ncbi:hypothetical protein B0T21DRAFT_7201 [Apiosordaria backusii]|uniref:AAA+ ATPase domain-containing protein n=1 Tax=Apiosordaria backusii TaxID=314023 RepID=A0AA40K6A5_9PEZI|nr:hypothetical protein B0T21DRAFT_7201 [Apiosordaria backusii]